MELPPSGLLLVCDRATNRTKRVSVRTGGAQANDTSTTPSISADGRFVAVMSDAPNLVASNLYTLSDIFVRGPLR